MGGLDADALARLLTDDERRVLPLLASSVPLNEIARELGVPRAAVLELAKSIFAKLDPAGGGQRHLTGL
jgi:DNA-binding CsgD family transcriptional regulator